VDLPLRHSAARAARDPLRPSPPGFCCTALESIHATARVHHAAAGRGLCLDRQKASRMSGFFRPNPRWERKGRRFATVRAIFRVTASRPALSAMFAVGGVIAPERQNSVCKLNISARPGQSLMMTTAEIVAAARASGAPAAPMHNKSHDCRLQTPAP
jgi:hypothetical protein